MWTREQVVRDHYLTTNSNYKRRASMLPAGFEPAIPASEWLQTLALYPTATGIGAVRYHYLIKIKFVTIDVTERNKISCHDIGLFF